MSMFKNKSMCDLIDLNSPDRKGFIDCRLASPLIPIPPETTGGNCNNRINHANSLVTGKRDSLENNPFDMVLHKTTEYIQKKDDPFEVVLEKALKPRYKKNPSSRTCSVDFTDDCHLKPKKSTQKLKMNKTLDEALINKELSQKNPFAKKISNERTEFELNKFDVQTDDLKSIDTPFNLPFSKNKYVISAIEIQDANLSILNQSIMNDALFEEESDICSDNQNKNLTNLRENINNMNYFSSSAALLKSPKLQRSFSQGENVLSKRPQYLENECKNNSGISFPLDFLNEGFLKSDSIESCSSQKSDNIKVNENQRSTNGSDSIVSTSKDIIKPVTNNLNKTKSSIPDLIDRLNKLKANALKLHVPENTTNRDNETTSSFSNDVKECVTVMGKKEECDTNNKLIDVDFFLPESNYSTEQCKNSISDASTDSVFLDGNKINQSILHEAKFLARTFEEMALKTSSGSSVDDLITSNPLWISELLPAFDDEVDNLIELPTSPNINNVNSNHEKVIHYKDNVLPENANEEPIVNKSTEIMKHLEKELVDPISTENRVTAATLLLDLKKLLKTENNMEANKLLENLEKVLCVNWENNTELLTTYLNLTNNLAKSPLEANNNLEIKNVAETNMECSQENNVTCDLSENVKESAFSKNLNSNDSSIDKSSANSSSVLSKSANRLSLDLESKKQQINKPLTRRSISVSHTPSTKTIPSPLLSKKKTTSQLKEVTKRFPSDPGFIAPITNKKITSNDNKHNSLRDRETKSVTTTNIDKEKSTAVGAVKNKLKKKIGGDIINKKGPMKAIIPIGNMQKRDCINKKINPSTDTTTPPKTHKIISSTPNSMINQNLVNKPTWPLKPVASSTPDAQNSKTRKIPSKTSNNVNKRNFGCDISPVTTHVNANNSNGVNCSPKRFGKIPSPKRTTPKRCSTDSSIPRSQTPPVNKKFNMSFDGNNYERLNESPRGSLCKVSNSQKNSPVSLKRNGNNTQQSPLRVNNKVIHKVKPINLISKLRRHSIGHNITEKENTYT